jgi:hypothetical protein
MTRSTIPWPIRGVLGGTAGTAKMTLAYETERRLRHNHRGPLDYDDTPVPGEVVVSIMHPGKVTDKEDNEVGLGLRWGYGWVFGIWHGLPHRRVRERWSSALFGATLMSATFSMFPYSDGRPRPTRWSADMMATAIAAHVAYVVAVATVDDVLGR